jgi:uncharacterized protein YbgA (DUF1722 family)/uncharacterized protein YbbK (DUF523 family)
MVSESTARPASATHEEIRIGISLCLLGEKVRFDGGHKHDRFLTDTVGPFVRFIPVCPEVDIGMGTPREPIHLVASEGGVQLVAPKSGEDYTVRMTRYARKKIADLAALSLDGYILKKDSPSCGMERVRVYGTGGMASRSGTGLFAAELIAALPRLPVEEEGRLNDPQLRENFFERVFAHRRLRIFFDGRWNVGDLVRFHAAEKLLLLAHDRPALASLGRLVAGAKGHPKAALAEEYQSAFMQGLRKLATVRKHTNVLQHAAGYFKNRLGTSEKQELIGAIEDYHRGLIPLIAPLILIRHYVRLHDVAHLAGQTYLEPHPKELMLRNHV